MDPMTEQIQELFSNIVQAMNDRDAVALTRQSSVPFAAYLLNDVLVARSREELIEMTLARINAVMSGDVTRADGRIVDVLQESPDRATVLFQWEFLRPDGSVAISDLIRYMVSRTRNGLVRIEMVEYLWVSDYQVAGGVLKQLKNQEPARALPN